MRLRWWMLVISLVMPVVASQREFAVIVHKSNEYDSLSSSKIAAIFMGKISRWPWGAETAPIDLRDSAAVKTEFLKTILKTTLAELKGYWLDQKLTRNADPPFQATDALAAKLRVASTPGAIAYIPRELLDETVKELKVE